MAAPGKVAIKEATMEVKHVLMHNKDTSYSIVKGFNPDKKPEEQKIWIFKGNLENPKPGMRYTVKFVKEFDASRASEENEGHYFKIRQSEMNVAGQESKGIIEYLLREAPNLGEKRARELVEAFGKETIDVLASRSAEVMALKGTQPGLFDGLTEARLKELSDWAVAEKTVEETKKILYGLGLTPGIVRNLISHFKSEVTKILKTDPFRFMEVDNIGFKTAWLIAKAAGCPKDDPNRIRCGIMHMLSEQEAEGHSCTEEEDLIYASQQLLDIPKALVKKYLDELLESGKLCSHKTNPQPFSKHPELFDISE